ncbi:NADH-cytochrome b5 reductase [Suillus subalutaceus]|uniref:NADH-cytochrome b5 reductase n=1 Tax=Suillus subalutaceus TaxID=48586 RepID=UPI001B87958D|nr:NADH-cytochrome b5 reductase [Suillus subalutaceus]KAG1867869.1 NADH-cytochrome b5 reductase [Suillus subalutaceus]
MSTLQALFAVSFLSTLAVLVFSFHWLRAKLREAGYDVSRLILIGLEPKIDTTQFPDRYQQHSNGIRYRQFVYTKRKPVLNPQVWQEFSLKEKIVISPNTAIYRFALPHPQDVLGLPIGQHISVSTEINGKDVMRSYTPTSSDDDLGHFDLLIKSYEKGNISRYVSLLKIGDKVRIRGPKGAFKYTPTLSREIGMIAGGTGITPMLQIIRAALKNSEDKTKLNLIYANVNFEDILLKKELDDLAAAHPKRFQVYYVLNNPPQGWNGGTGFVTKDQIEKHMPSSNHDIKVLMCGPPPMITAMKKHLAELNYPAPRTISKLEDQIFAF